MTTTRDERKTASGIEWVTKTTVMPVRSQIRRTSWFIRSRVISSSAPNGSSISRIDGSKASARAIATRCCMPPDSWYGWWWRKSPSSTSSSISFARAVRRGAVVAHQLERQLDVVLHRSPVEQDRRLEDDPVVAVAPGALGRLVVDRHPAGGRRDQVADDPQQGGLAAAGRTDQRDELAAPDVEIDPWSAVVTRAWSVTKVLSSAAIRTTGPASSWRAAASWRPALSGRPSGSTFGRGRVGRAGRPARPPG